jgi:hypothetical protein
VENARTADGTFQALKRKKPENQIFDFPAFFF